MLEVVRTIPLSRGFVAKVSDSDYESLSQFKWRAHYNPITRSWYATRRGRVNGKMTTISMARTILGLEHGNPLQGDHRDHDSLNNCRSNLRIVTRSQNCQNRRKRSDNTSTFKGVTWDPRANNTGKWRVQIWIDGTNRLVGRYDDPITAAKAYDEAAREAFGQFALTNFPREIVSDTLAAATLAEAA